MNNFWRRTKPIIWGAVCVVLALYLSPLSISVGYVLATHDIAPLWAKLFKPGFTFMVAFLGMFMTFVAFCVAVGAVITARQKQEMLSSIFYYAALFCIIFIMGWFSPLRFHHVWPLRRAGLQQAATRARPLISAIEKFQSEKKHIPHNLQELVPNYLPDIPQTGMIAYPQFDNSTHDERAGRAKFQTYQLQVKTSAGFLNWDTFNYWPEGDYPAEMYGGRVERIGAWAYVHE